jgi:NAD+ kinase
MIGVIAHANKPAAAAAVKELIHELESRPLPYLLHRDTAPLAGKSSTLDEAALAERCDLLVVMGGDGTILRAVQQMPDRLPPVFGINIGTLGFLTCLGAREIHRAIESIVAKDFNLSPRALMKAVLRRADGSSEALHALNDVVVGRGEHSQLVRVRVSLGGVPLTEYNADGLIVATPTGSTAYSLSAGGPILMPDCGCFVITPICPHVLTNRSVVIADKSVVEISTTKPGQTVSITVDARSWSQLAPGETLVLEKSQRVLPLAMLPERPFTGVLREKLKWTGSNI